MQNIAQTLEKAEASCDAHGTRLTTKRKHVLTCLLESQKAHSAYDLIESVKATFGDHMQPTTMYRILDFLVSENLVHKLQLANKYVACSHITCEVCEHGHVVPQFLICNACNRVDEIRIESELLQQLTTNVQQAGYTLMSPQLELHCLCGDCASKAA
ncbi:MAG: transcriptional repressor [Halieaceae bacterium]|nr:transcriptional repressor [Halieaceae bacterium]